MDPAGPGFEKADIKSKLHSSNAQYVQCIYTDGNALGTKTKLGDGHGNFIMNGGGNQPGCDLIPICDHSRAYEYFKASMFENNKIEGEECRVKDNKSRKDRIGIYSAKINGTFCVETGSEFPYANLSK